MALEFALQVVFDHAKSQLPEAVRPRVIQRWQLRGHGNNLHSSLPAVAGSVYTAFYTATRDLPARAGVGRHDQARTSLVNDGAPLIVSGDSSLGMTTSLFHINTKFCYFYPIVCISSHTPVGFVSCMFLFNLVVSVGGQVNLLSATSFREDCFQIDMFLVVLISSIQACFPQFVDGAVSICFQVIIHIRSVCDSTSCFMYEELGHSNSAARGLWRLVN